MTNEIKPPAGDNGQYKQLYYRNKRDKPYTSTQMGLDDYLQTDVWHELRRERLEKDLYHCAHCGTGMNLNVHHIRYPKIWGTEDVDSDLITLCDKCHAEAHKYDLANEEVIYS